MSKLYVTSVALAAAAIVVIGLLAGSVRAEDAAAAAPTTQAAGGATGTWKYEIDTPNGAVEVVMTLKQEGQKVTGTVSGWGGDENDIEDGKIVGDQVSFKVVREFGGRQMVTTYSGTLSGNEFKGKAETVFSQDFEAKRGEAQQ